MTELIISSSPKVMANMSSLSTKSFGDETSSFPFPPGCKVLCFNKSGVRVGVVKNVLANITKEDFVGSYYEVEIKGSSQGGINRAKETSLFPASDLRLTPDTRVEVSSDYFGSVFRFSGSGGKVQGTILGSYEMPASLASQEEERRYFYSVRVKFEGMNEAVEAHGVPPENIMVPQINSEEYLGELFFSKSHDIDAIKDGNVDDVDRTIGTPSVSRPPRTSSRTPIRSDRENISPDEDINNSSFRRERSRSREPKRRNRSMSITRDNNDTNLLSPESPKRNKKNKSRTTSRTPVKSSASSTRSQSLPFRDVFTNSHNTGNNNDHHSSTHLSIASSGHYHADDDDSRYMDEIPTPSKPVSAKKGRLTSRQRLEKEETPRNNLKKTSQMINNHSSLHDDGYDSPIVDDRSEGEDDNRDESAVRTETSVIHIETTSQNKPLLRVRNTPISPQARSVESEEMSFDSKDFEEEDSLYRKKSPHKQSRSQSFQPQSNEIKEFEAPMTMPKVKEEDEEFDDIEEDILETTPKSKTRSKMQLGKSVPFDESPKGYSSVKKVNSPKKFGRNFTPQKSISVVKALESEEEPVDEPSPSTEEGCYLVYSETSGGRLILQYSHTRVKEAIGFWCPGMKKKLQGFKFKQNGGRTDLIKGIVGSDAKKKFYSGWCQFVKAASTYDGYVCKWPGNGLEVDIVVFIKETCEVKKMEEEGKMYDVSNIGAVACIPKGNSTFDGVRTGEYSTFMNIGNNTGSSISV